MEGRSASFVILSLAVLATACGIEDRSQAPQTRSSEVTVALAGTVSGSPGALTFHRLPLRTGSALVTVQGRPTTPAKIRPGSVLRGTASKTPQGYELLSAEVHHEIEGIIERVDLYGSRLAVMGQNVLVGAHTDIGEEGPAATSRSLQLADLKAGDRIEVDGFSATDGSVEATHIELVPASQDPAGSFHGVVGALDSLAGTATAGGCIISFGSAQVSGSLVPGARVEVQGNLSGRTLLASSVRVETGLEDLAGTTLEICGPISSFDPVAKTFLLMSYKVDYSRANVEGTLANGASVMAEARLNMEGTVPVSFSMVRVGTRVEVQLLNARADPLRGTRWAGDANRRS